MSDPKEFLRTLVNSMPESIENLERALSSIDETDEEIDSQISAIRDGFCENVKNELDNYLRLEKLPYFIENVNPTSFLVYEPDFGTIGYGRQLDGWSIRALIEQPYPDPPIEEVIYSTTVNWDNDAFIVKWMQDWYEGNDFLTRPLTSGATYGLIPYKNSLANASNILNENKSKLERSYEIFSRYLE